LPEILWKNSSSSWDFAADLVDGIIAYNSPGAVHQYLPPDRQDIPIEIELDYYEPSSLKSG
jgi:hypothetical protein